MTIEGKQTWTKWPTIEDAINTLATRLAEDYEVKRVWTKKDRELVARAMFLSTAGEMKSYSGIHHITWSATVTDNEQTIRWTITR